MDGDIEILEDEDETVINDVDMISLKPYFKKSSRQQIRDRAAIKERLKVVQEYCKRINLKISSIKLSEISENENINQNESEYKLTIEKEITNSNQTNQSKKILKAKDLSFLSDMNYQKFKNEAEIGLPSLRKIKSMRKEITNQFDIYPNSSGFYINLVQKLEMVVQRFIQDGGKLTNNQIIVKYSGDSTNITNSLKKVLNFTFTLINDTYSAKSIKGQFVFGMFLIEKENYDDVKESIKEIVQIIEENKSIQVNNKSYNIERIFGGDMKFLSILYGINQANANYPCIWCKCHKDDFRDTKKKWSITDPTFGARKLEEAMELHKFYGKKRDESHKGYQKEPISSIEFDKCAIDILHLFLRITDVLLDLFFYDLFQVDNNDSIDLEKRPNLKQFVHFLEFDCKVLKPIFFKESKEIKLRSFDGTEKKKIFSRTDLAKNFPNVKNILNIEMLWIEFMNIIDKIKEFDGESNIDTEELELMLHQWLFLFLRCYFPENITRYIHAFVFHIPEFIRLFKNIDAFNLQGLEKLNDVSTNIYFKSTNRQDKSFLRQMIEKRNRIEYYSLSS